jgi:hypothetical protein
MIGASRANMLQEDQEAALPTCAPQNIENNPMQSNRSPPPFETALDMSGKSAAFPHHPAIL